MVLQDPRRSTGRAELFGIENIPGRARRDTKRVDELRIFRIQLCFDVDARFVCYGVLFATDEFSIVFFYSNGFPNGQELSEE